MTDFDLLIIGGGPVGLAASIFARMSGLSVAIIEQRSGVIDKACGEGLMPGAVHLLDELGVNPIGEKLEGISYNSNKHSVTHRFSKGTGLGVRRTELSTKLFARASDVGVEFIQTKLENVTQDQNQVIAFCSNDSIFKSKYLIGADGLHSSVARLVGLSKPTKSNNDKRYGIRQHFNVEPWSSFVEVHYTKTAEVYITPVSQSQVGVAILGHRSQDYLETIESIPELATRLRGATVASQRSGSGSFPQSTHSRRKGRVLLVGDASGYVDAITGEGLRLGFAQSKEAINCITSDTPESYERKWKRVSNDFRVLTTGLVTLANSPLRMSIVPLATKMPWLFGYVVDRLAR